MKKWNILRIVGFVAALVLIVFGSLDNVMRSIRLVGERLKRKEE